MYDIGIADRRFFFFEREHVVTVKYKFALYFEHKLYLEKVIIYLMYQLLVFNSSKYTVSFIHVLYIRSLLAIYAIVWCASNSSGFILQHQFDRYKFRLLLAQLLTTIFI